ncbi:MAG: PadR family transcriptional regulator [Candidatus Micrarchaeota archaeon]
MVNQFEGTLNAVFAGINGSKHILHLYAPSINKYALHATFLSKRSGVTAYVTGEKPNTVFEQFDFLSNKFSVIHPTRLDKIKQYKNVVIDAATINPKTYAKKLVRGLVLKKQTIHKRKVLGQHEIIKLYIDHIKRENFLNELKQKPHIMCSYNISLLEAEQIKQLVQVHDKFILTTDDTMVLSSKTLSLKNLKLGEKKVEQLVKNELETIILALVCSNPMCGNDIKKKIYEKFDVLLSSGTIYPLLHKLEKQGLLKCAYGVKTKTYKALDEDKIKKTLDESIQTKRFLNGFIHSHAQIGGKREKTKVAGDG